MVKHFYNINENWLKFGNNTESHIIYDYEQILIGQNWTGRVCYLLQSHTFEVSLRILMFPFIRVNY